MADVHRTLESIIETVLDARAMPLSASCVLNRLELLEALEDLRAQLPREIARARRVLAERDVILGAACHERDRAVAGADIVKQAESEAERIAAAAREASRAARSEIDIYVDRKLAAFEVVLSRTLTSVERGRAWLASPTAGTAARPDVPVDGADGEAAVPVPLADVPPPPATPDVVSVSEPTETIG